MIANSFGRRFHCIHEIYYTRFFFGGLFIIFINYTRRFYPLTIKEFFISRYILFGLAFEFFFPSMINSFHLMRIADKVFAIFTSAKVPTINIICVSILIIINTIAAYFFLISP